MTEKKKVIVLGNLPLATKVIQLLQQTPEVELVGAIHPAVERKYPSLGGESCAYAYCKQHGIRRMSVEDIIRVKGLDLAISARNDTILKPEFIQLFKLGVVNCHGGYLPDYRGVGGHMFPILNNESHTGGTVHWMVERIDQGDVIDREQVIIEPRDTGFDLFLKINDALYRLIVVNLARILSGSISGISQADLPITTRLGHSYYYYKKDVRKLYEVGDDSDIMRRALYWPQLG